MSTHAGLESKAWGIDEGDLHKMGDLLAQGVY